MTSQNSSERSRTFPDADEPRAYPVRTRSPGTEASTSRRRGTTAGALLIVAAIALVIGCGVASNYVPSPEAPAQPENVVPAESKFSGRCQL